MLNTTTRPQNYNSDNSRLIFHNNKIYALDCLKDIVTNLISTNDDGLENFFLIKMFKLKTINMQWENNFDQVHRSNSELLQELQEELSYKYPIYQSEINQLCLKYSYYNETIIKCDIFLQEICQQYDQQFSKLRSIFGNGYTQTTTNFIEYLDELSNQIFIPTIIKKIDKLYDQIRDFCIVDGILFYKSKDLDKNLNGKVFSQDGQKLLCRHLATFRLIEAELQHIHRSTSPSDVKHKIKHLQNKADILKQKFLMDRICDHPDFIEIADQVIYTNNNGFGNALGNMSPASEQPSYIILYTDCHVMSITMFLQPDMSIKGEFYDPNSQKSKKFIAKNYESLVNLSINSLLSDDLIIDYNADSSEYTMARYNSPIQTSNDINHVIQIQKYLINIDQDDVTIEINIT